MICSRASEPTKDRVSVPMFPEKPFDLNTKHSVVVEQGKSDRASSSDCCVQLIFNPTAEGWMEVLCHEISFLCCQLSGTRAGSHLPA